MPDVTGGATGGSNAVGAGRRRSGRSVPSLEDIGGAKALAWVHEQNQRTFQRLERLPDYQGLYHDALTVLDSQSRIPEIEQRGAYLYNLWQDKEHPRGLFRRATIAEFRQPAPRWETVLDVDALARTEGKPWAFGGMTGLPPDYQHALISLSPGGGDAVEVREFDTRARSFVTNGFFLPVAKSSVSWLDPDTLFVETDFGPDTLTRSGYPRIVKIWRRGVPLAETKPLYESDITSVSAGARRIRTSSGDIDLVTDGITFWKRRYFQLVRGALERLDVPETAVISDGYQGRLLIRLKADWQRASQRFQAGSVLLADPAALRGGSGEIQLLVPPATNEVVQGMAAIPQGIFVTLLDDVRGRLYRYDVSNGKIQRQLIPFPDNGSLSITSASDETGEVFVQYESFLDPPTLYYIGCNSLHPEPVKSQQPSFDARPFQARQVLDYFGGRHPYPLFRRGLEAHAVQRPKPGLDVFLWRF